jgi:hypothetical protein
MVMMVVIVMVVAVMVMVVVMVVVVVMVAVMVAGHTTCSPDRGSDLVSDSSCPHFLTSQLPCDRGTVLFTL